MRIPTVSELLDAWERGTPRSAAERATLLLTVGCGEPPQELARLPIGFRDSRLLSLRDQLFGSRMDCRADCPKCCERLEVAFDSNDVRASAMADEATQVPSELALELEDFRVRFRLPDADDLAAAADCAEVNAARQRLLDRCLLQATRGNREIEATSLPGAVADAVAARMGEADPQADVQLDLVCPACSHRWHASFDAGAFLWAELDAWARRTLREVHLLAAAYGWCESDILALSPARRRLYLEMTGESIGT